MEEIQLWTLTVPECSRQQSNHSVDQWSKQSGFAFLFLWQGGPTCSSSSLAGSSSRLSGPDLNKQLIAFIQLLWDLFCLPHQGLWGPTASSSRRWRKDQDPFSELRTAELRETPCLFCLKYSRWQLKVNPTRWMYSNPPDTNFPAPQAQPNRNVFLDVAWGREVVLHNVSGQGKASESPVRWLPGTHPSSPTRASN